MYVLILCVKEPCYQTFAQLQKIGPLTAPYSILPGNQPNQESRLRENFSLPPAFPQWPDHAHWTHSTFWRAAATYQVGSFTSYGVQLSRDLIRSNTFLTISLLSGEICLHQQQLTTTTVKLYTGLWQHAPFLSVISLQMMTRIQN